FEKAANSGGLLRYGIPDFKLKKKIIDRRLNLMQEQGIRFECNVEIGEDISMRYLKNNYDAVVLAIGAGKPRDLPLASRSLQGIYFAMEYLTASNKFTAGEIDKKDIITAENKNVLVIGGGDTGSDCVGTAVRQNAARVYQFEILPRPSQWSKPENPSWPCRPQILKSTSSHAEGCDRRWGVSVKKFSSSGLKVQRAHFEKVKWYTDHKGKQCFEPIKGSDFAVDAQLVILAMGFLHVEHSGLLDRLKLKLDKRDNIWTDQNNMTSEPGIFAAGDGVSGASLVVTAIKAGRQTAAAVDKYLAHV
ncbi:MAG TPA: FAD-dependent oxidoreductase, partial [Spirochaetota bacterium]|nr:FAD-dependent oxidoreductase [Spirochaetota bacterium]